MPRASAGAEYQEVLPRAWLRGTHDFSFSGLKTAILHKAMDLGIYPQEEGISPDVKIVT